MDYRCPIAASTGSNNINTGMLRFATGMFVGKPVTQRGSTFDTFGNATARLRPRYRNGHSPADGHGHRS
ncbi:hypothetical protein [Halocatena marina]|uniref:Uncharacterized protein n=1 Tax=Halocatena marina TaxID=2934937 RepID=A0ABD5YV53_9EURY|nr:hypothetical protein [Halocatena marina]